MLKCPYCFEILEGKINRCPHCMEFVIDALIEAEFRSLDKKKCIFCGKKILSEARVCKYCHQWSDDLDQAVDGLQDTE